MVRGDIWYLSTVFLTLLPTVGRVVCARPPRSPADVLADRGRAVQHQQHVRLQQVLRSLHLKLTDAHAESHPVAAAEDSSAQSQ